MLQKKGDFLGGGEEIEGVDEDQYWVLLFHFTPIAQMKRHSSANYFL